MPPVSSLRCSDGGIGEVLPSSSDWVSQASALYPVPQGSLLESRRVLCFKCAVLALRAEPDQTLTRKGVCPCVCYCASVCVRRECWELSLVLKRELINKWQNTQCLKGNASNRRNMACLKFYLFLAKIVKILTKGPHWGFTYQQKKSQFV